LCDENGICADGEYCGDNESQLDRINVLYHRPQTAGTYHAVFSDLKPGVIGALRASLLG
jgi:tubulin beta